MNNHITRDYRDRVIAACRQQDIVPNPTYPYGFRCPTCRLGEQPGEVSAYVDGKPRPVTCPDCGGTCWQWARYPAGVPAPGVSCSAVDGMNVRRNDIRYAPWSGRFGGTPAPREAWTGETVTLGWSGEGWVPTVWSLPNRRGWLVGWYSECSGTVAWEPTAYPYDPDDEGDVPSDVIRAAVAVAEHSASVEAQYQETYEDAMGEGRAAGTAGALADSFSDSCVSEDHREPWEEARAEAYANAAKEAGLAAGRNGHAPDPATWPGDVSQYQAGFAAGRTALYGAVQRARATDSTNSED